MTRIIMSDHVTLKQNARQNGLLIFMFAIAFSVGPVKRSHTMLITGYRRRTHIGLMARD